MLPRLNGTRVTLVCDASRVLFQSLEEIDEAIRACWAPDTCDPVDLADWSAANPARGQCAVTALVVQDLLGGELLLAEVSHADGSHQGLHYWNRLSGGAEVDLTRGQFSRAEIIGPPRLVARPPDTTQGRLAEQYRVLLKRVADRLGLAAVAGGTSPRTGAEPPACATDYFRNPS